MLPKLQSFWTGLLCLAACKGGIRFNPNDEQDPGSAARQRMVEDQLTGVIDAIQDPRVIAAMRKVPRHEFVPEGMRPYAYEDRPLPIGFGQTISQPRIVAFMTEILRPRENDRILEIGTGSGYQAAILAELVREVYSIEIIPELAERASADFLRLGYSNIHVRVADGYQGWPEAAPFDAIIVTCAPDDIPPPLVAQLRDGGRLIIPVDTFGNQALVLLHKQGTRLERQTVLPVRFVPMTGQAERPRESSQR